MKLQEIATAIDAQVIMGEGADLSSIAVSAVSTDSRSIGENELFVALSGDNFDGHKFVTAAIEKGCCAVVVEKKQSVSVPQLVVKDCLKALGEIGALYRRQFNGQVIGITGSCGKTTVKEMLSAALSPFGKVMATIGNLNNEIGVPLTLCRLSEDASFAVVEMGANHIGEIAYTSSLTKPDVVIISNAGNAHLEGFGSYEGIVQAKGEIIDSLGENGVVILNFDDQAFDIWKQRAADKTCISFSVNKTLTNNSGLTASNLVLNESGSTFDVDIYDEAGSLNSIKGVCVPLPGKHNVSNALAVLAAVNGLGLDIEEAAKGLARFETVGGRMRRLQLSNNCLLIDDSYNANPASMGAAFSVLSQLTGQKWVLLGDMAELGEKAPLLHKETAQSAANEGVDKLIAVGRFAEEYAAGFGKDAIVCQSQDELVALVAGWLNEQEDQVNILVKGSRSAAMEKVVEALRKNSVSKAEMPA